jgi:hypothetical protein
VNRPRNLIEASTIPQEQVGRAHPAGAIEPRAAQIAPVVDPHRPVEQRQDRQAGREGRAGAGDVDGAAGDEGVGVVAIAGRGLL